MTAADGTAPITPPVQLCRTVEKVNAGLTSGKYWQPTAAFITDNSCMLTGISSVPYFRLVSIVLRLPLNTFTFTFIG